jgi:hypothetical protein
MTLISTLTAGAGLPGTLEFASIPQTYTDLLLTFSARRSSGSGFVALKIQFNSSTTGYTDRWLQGSGSAATSSTDSTQTGFGGAITSVPGTATTANTFNNGQCYIPNYAGSTNKTISMDTVTENNATESYQHILAGVWANTAAVTNIKLLIGSFDQYTTASLYGILKGSGGASVA